MVIALAGLVAVMVSAVLVRPLQGFVDQSRRAELVDLAATALNRMARDVRLAVPNSVRVSTDGSAVEMLLIQTSATNPDFSGAARYRPNRMSSETLQFADSGAGSCDSTVAGGACNVVELLAPNFDPAGAQWMVVYNIGSQSGTAPVAGANVWAPANPGVITPSGTSFSVTGSAGGATQVALDLPGASGEFTFAFESPQRRVYFAESVVGYRCDGDRLLRYSYGELLAEVPSSPPAGSNPRLLANSVRGCSFLYQPGTTVRAGLLSMTLELDQEGEALRLMQQVHVDNAP
jgi:MSHA biogenesis protein MshO